MLLQGGALPAMPERLHMSKVTGYLDYARFLKKPRSAELMAVLEAPVVAAEPPPRSATPQLLGPAVLLELIVGTATPGMARR